MPLCRASDADMLGVLQDQLSDLQQGSKNLISMIGQAAQNQEKIAEVEQEIQLQQQLNGQLRTLRRLRSLRLGARDLTRLVGDCQRQVQAQKQQLQQAAAATGPRQLSQLQERFRGQISQPLVYFQLLKAQSLMIEIKHYRQNASYINQQLPFLRLSSASQLLEVKHQLESYQNQNDDTRAISERISQLKIENAALREQIFSYEEKISGEDNALLMKIEALSKQLSARNEQERQASQNDTMLQQQIDEYLDAIDSRIDAENILTDYQLQKQYVQQLKSELTKCQDELLLIKQDGVSRQEYEQSKVEMQKKFDSFCAEVNKLGKMGQNQVYQDYLLLLKKINSIE